jgi:thiamine-monophosphate kinase
LSDIAATGGDPIAAFLSLALPSKLSQPWFDGFISGLLALAKRFGVVLAGGDTASSPGGVLADVTVLGSILKGTAVLPSNARPGDRIYVTGALGASAATLDLLYSKSRRLNAASYPAHFFQAPRIAVGRILRQKRIAASMIDISDGLSSEILHICRRSSCGCDIYEDKIPIDPQTYERAREFGLDPTVCALSGGEDYELLFTIAQTDYEKLREHVDISIIGHITDAAAGVHLIDKSGNVVPMIAQGWDSLLKNVSSENGA